jgi:hypothetical protein
MDGRATEREGRENGGCYTESAAAANATGIDMSRFTVYKDPRRQRRQTAFAWFFVILAILTLISEFFVEWRWKYLGHWALFFLFLSTGIEKLRKKKRVYFFEVTPAQLEWLFQEQAEKTIIPWEDIQWIKKEKNGSISFFQESSFSKNVLLNMFPEEEKKLIEKEMEVIALNRGIRLINFSGAV